MNSKHIWPHGFIPLMEMYPVHNMSRALRSLVIEKKLTSQSIPQTYLAIKPFVPLNVY